MMESLISYLTETQLVFHFNWMDLLNFSIFLTILWIAVLGWRLCIVYRNENPEKEAYDWLFTPYGICFFKVVFAPLIPFLAIIFVVSIPLSLAYMLTLKLVEKVHSFLRD